MGHWVSRFFILIRLILISFLVLNAHRILANQNNHGLKNIAAELQSTQKQILQSERNQEKSHRELSGIYLELENTQKQILQSTLELKKNDQTLGKISSKLHLTQKQINTLEKQRKSSSKEIQQLNRQLISLENQINNIQKNTARVLSDYYKQHTHSTPSIPVSMQQQKRLSQYMQEINLHSSSLMMQLSSQKKKITQQQQLLAQKQKQIADITKQQQTIALNLENKKKQHTIYQQQINKQLSAQTEQLKQLKQGENRLKLSLRNLSSQSPTVPKKNTVKPSSTLTKEDLSLQDPNKNTNNAPDFERLRFKLKHPISAAITGHYQAVANHGGRWNGLFFQSPRGTDVYSIASGYVVQVIDLDGYGKTVIIDHGQRYFSIYAGLSSVVINTGFVKAGELIARSGHFPAEGNGLYFEIRRGPQPLNPSSWL